MKSITGFWEWTLDNPFHILLELICIGALFMLLYCLGRAIRCVAGKDKQ